MLYVLYIVVTCTVHDPILMCVHCYMVRVCVCSCTVKRQSRAGFDPTTYDRSNVSKKIK